MAHLEQWQQRWDIGNIGFHRSYVNKILEEHVDILTKGRKGLKIFLPLCGKSLDLLWLVDLGHDVTGLEFCDIACQAFFKENNIDYTTSTVDGLQDATLYVSKDTRIRIYQCDFFQFSSDVTGQFDAVWDRAAFGAVNPPDRKRYSDVLSSLIKGDGMCLMTTLQYDTTVMTGPPQHTHAAVVQECYGNRYDVKIIKKIDVLDGENWRAMGHNHITETVYSLSPKTT